MPKYMFHGSYSASGGTGVLKDGGTGRKQAVEVLAASVGGKLESIYWALGDDDFFIVCEMPDSHAAAALAIAVSATGAVTTSTSELFDAADLDDIISRRANYRAPGA